ncbi:MAG TPA: hypothetical protein VI461_11200, partial [Chitinophagaceae bacterium]|nr:hypothetical protein [Chitinophagaceae bacterium]
LPASQNLQTSGQNQMTATIGHIPAFDKFDKNDNSTAVDQSFDYLITNQPDAESFFVVETTNPSIVSTGRYLDDITGEESGNNSSQISDLSSADTDELTPSNTRISFTDPGITLTNRESNIKFPLTIGSTVNSNRSKKSNFKKRVSWQVYFTPTVSYRKLRDNKSLQNSTFFLNNRNYGYPFASTGSVNTAVTHKPDLGLELGFSAGYPLSKTFKLTAGLQFNINRYDIRAYVYNREPATINLNGDGNNSLTTWTSYRNYNGYKSDWLKNFYFSASAPVGAQVRLFGNNKTHFGFAGTVQPTLILRDRAYLISSDYKNYAEVPDLIRRFNMNTSFETFISYKNRNTRWQIGPQVRYQVLSSFQSKYPVKENLFDFGVKIGISLNE